jgi:hypothetical protein
MSGPGSSRAEEELAMKIPVYLLAAFVAAGSLPAAFAQASGE